jgi:hypothetical protein
MHQCHRLQHSIIKSLSRSCKLETPFDSEPRRQAALLLSIELGKLRSNLQNWIASHRAYLCSLNLWLHKCMKPLRKRKSSRKQNTAAADVSLTECAVAPMFAACEIWMKLLDDLPTGDLEEPIEGLVAGISRHLPRHSDQHLDGTLNGETEGVDAPPRDDAAADLRPGLVTFMEKLEAFSEISVQKYLDLQRGVRAAKDRLLKEA